MPDANLAFVERHRQSLMHRFSGLVHLIRIDDERLVHHFTGAGERRYDQYTGIVDLTGDEFFSHQIHPVPQRRHDGDGSVPIESGQFGLLASFNNQNQEISSSF